MQASFGAGRLKLNKRGHIILAIFIASAIALGVRLFYIQIVNFEKYQSDTINQYIREVEVEAKRGTIYDRNMKVLAISTNVERVFISPNTIPGGTVAEFIEEQVEKIKDSDKKKAERTRLLSVFENTSITVAQDIANELSAYLGVSTDMVLERAAKTKRADETIQRQVPLETTAEIKKMVAEKGYSNMIHFAGETKRYYPYNSLASHVIGFCGTDGDGLYGAEAYYNDLLTGENGKMIYGKDGVGNEMSTKYESYIDAKNGSDIMLTIDWTCQSILEKYLQEALNDTNAQNRVCGIIMDVNTAEILAMATKPDFDLNDPFVLDSISQALLDGFEGTEEEKDTAYRNLLYELWKNKAITELYEPGSTFKIITSAMVLEENLVTKTETFRCTGAVRVPGLSQPIHCHKLVGHGTQTFAEALGNSCNPVFVAMGQRLGKDLFYKYYKAFGYSETTGVDILGEASNLFFDLSTYSSVDVVCAAFGENFMVTPISHLRAVCAVANGGYLVTPHVLKATLDDQGNVVESYAVDNSRQVVSHENCEEIWQYLYDSVEDGGNRNAAVQGYKIAAKTGTSTKSEDNENGTHRYVGSCVAFAPADAPEIAVIFIVDEPVGNYYGSLVAAPYVAKIMSEVLPYLGVDPVYTEEEIGGLGIMVSDYTGKTLTAATNDLTEKGFTVRVEGNGGQVVEQSPAYGTSMPKGSTVVLYTEKGLKNPNVAVPNLLGLSASAANAALVNAGLNVSISNATLNGLEGATVSKQSIAAGEMVAPGTVVVIEFKYVAGATD